MLELDRRDASVRQPAVNAVAPARTPSITAASTSRAAWLAGLSAGLLVLAILALWIDLPVAQFIKGRGLSGELRRLVRLSEAFGWGGTVGIIILLAALLDPRGWRVAWRLAICSFGAGLTADAIKLLIGRLRPAHADLAGSASETFAAWLPAWRAESLGLDYGHNLQSFPSGHAATAAGLAVALAFLYPRARWLFAAFAVLASLQRVEAQSHFVSDVVAGAALGCLLGALCELPGPLARWLRRCEGEMVH